MFTLEFVHAKCINAILFHKLMLSEFGCFIIAKQYAIMRLRTLLEIFLGFGKSDPQHAYVRYAFKKYMYIQILILWQISIRNVFFNFTKATKVKKSITFAILKTKSDSHSVSGIFGLPYCQANLFLQIVFTKLASHHIFF